MTVVCLATKTTWKYTGIYRRGELKVIHHQLNEIEPPVKVNVQGGDTLMVSWKYDDGQYSNVTLTGPALSVFKGEINV